MLLCLCSSHIKPSFPGRTPPPPPPPVVVESEQEFEVEQILDLRFIRNRLVKWKGYSISENYWEPDHFLKSSLDLVKSFHSRYPQNLIPAVNLLRFLPPHLLPSSAGPAPGNSPTLASAEASLSSSGTSSLASNSTPVFANIAVFTVESSLRQRILDALSVDPIADEQRRISTTATAIANSPWSWENGLLLHKNLIYIPQDDAIRLELLWEHHNSLLARHYGIAKTYELLSRNYYFPGMLSFIKSYISTCDLCSCRNAPRHAKCGELSPLPVPSGPWKSISCDFITDLPPSNGWSN